MRIRYLLVALAVMVLACTGDDPEPAGDASGDTTSTSSPPTTDSGSGGTSSTTTTTTEPPPPFVVADYGVDDDEIRVGASADLTGPRAQVTAAMIDGQIAYFETVNAGGGIAERRITLVVRDHASDLDTHVDNYTELSEASEAGVAILSATGDEEQTAAILLEMTADSLFGVTSASAAEWATAVGRPILEIGATTCIEAMNGIEFLASRIAVDATFEPATADEPDDVTPTVAIVSRLGAYGREGAAGARFAASELGLEVVADLDGNVGPAAIADITQALIDADPDLVWVTVSPPELAQLIVGATAGGVDALWSGNSPSYNSALLRTAAAPVLADRYLHSGVNEPWGSGTPAMEAVAAALTAELPDGGYDEANAYLAGWLQAAAVTAILEEAARAEDMTRPGIGAAAERVTFDGAGVAPTQSWGPSVTSLVRHTYFAEVDPEVATLDRTLRQIGSTGLRPVDGPYRGTVAADVRPELVCQAGLGLSIR